MATATECLQLYRFGYLIYQTEGTINILFSDVESIQCGMCQGYIRFWMDMKGAFIESRIVLTGELQGCPVNMLVNNSWLLSSVIYNSPLNVR